MLNQIVSIFGSVFRACAVWLENLFSASSMLGFYLGAIGIVAMIRFILMPLFGGGVTSGSDTVLVSHSRSNSLHHSDSSDEVTM